MALPRKSYRQLALERAKRYVGVRENPPNSNRGPLIDQWNLRAGVPLGTPWCASFVCAMFGDVGRPIRYPRRASVGFLYAWAEDMGFAVDRPLRGDLVCYDWDGTPGYVGWLDHIGFVDRVLAVRWRGKAFVGWIRTVEGNTSFTDQSNGGQVMIRYRWCRACKFIRIPGVPA